METNNATTIYRHLYDKTPSCPHTLNRADLGTRKGERVCKLCKGMVVARRVTFAVFEWRGDGMYRLADAIATHSREAVAESAARQYSDTAVVRTISVD